MTSTHNVIIFILIVVVLALALWVRSLEKALDDLETTMLTLMAWKEKQVTFNERMFNRHKNNMTWHELQEQINDRTLAWCKNTDKTIDDMLDTQIKLTELGNETHTKYLEAQAQINGIKFELDNMIKEVNDE